MKDKNVAGILALFLGGFGIHRFYLGQVGLGILYCLFFWTPIFWIVGLIDAIMFFSMDRDRFDIKYNRKFYQATKRPDNAFDRRRSEREEEIEKWERRQGREKNRWERDRKRPTESRRPSVRQNPKTNARPRPAVRKNNPYKESGIRKYKDYDYDGAITDFEKALSVNPGDVATHFNIACAYSLNEETDKAVYHLDKAVALGFNDFQKIKEHDALAYVRIQPNFDEFERNGFRSVAQLAEPKEEMLDLNSSGNLLETLKQLGELREKGLLTETEFAAQKRKLLG